MEKTELLKSPVSNKFGKKVIFQEILCKHCIEAGRIDEAFGLYEKYKENVMLTLEYFMICRDILLKRPIQIIRVLSCQEGHQNIYKEQYGADWDKHYTQYSGHLYGLAPDIMINDLSELSRMLIHLPLEGVTRFGFSANRTVNLKFHFDLWNLEYMQKKYLPEGKEIAREAVWFYK